MRGGWSRACGSTLQAGACASTGPDTGNRDESWSVSFEISVPRNAMLTLNTNNGGISIDDFRGSAKFHARTAGWSRTSVGGDLRRDDQRRRHRGRRRSLGRRRASTSDHNGGIRPHPPEGASQRSSKPAPRTAASASTSPLPQGRIGRHLETTLGAGAPKLRAMTTNGGVTIRQR